MRLITQNGQRDLPYDSYIVSVGDDGFVFADNVHHEGKFSRVLLGVYGSEVEAKLAVSEMHDAWEMGDSIFKFPEARKRD
ncbi:MAG: hypothetical protein IJ680_06735 [Paludibacteraceae bacterium]|nr:hypothetical protein [Paludibacteraceae bacterium]